MASQSGDDLYSDDSGGDASPHENDAFSPTDGYFQPRVDDSHSSAAEGSRGGPRAPSHAVPHVPDVMVDDPTLSDTRTAKETEALQDRQQDGQQNSANIETRVEEGATSSHNHQGPSTFGQLQNSQRERDEASVASISIPNLTVSDISSVRHSSQTLSETTPRLQPSGHLLPAQIIDAPPAYSSARPANYGTIEPAIQEIPSRNRAEEEYSAAHENEPLLSPQRSLQHDTVHNLRTTSKRVSSKTASRICLGLIIFLTATLSSLITAAIILRPTAPKTESIDTEPIGGSSPEATLSWKPPPESNCRNTPYRLAQASYDVFLAPESSINIVEEGWSNDAGRTEGTAVTVFGEVVIRTAPSGAGPGMTIDGFSNDPRIKPHLNIRSGHLTQTYYLTGPRSALNWPDDAGSPCYQGHIILWLPAGSVFESTAIISEHFDASIRSGLNISNPGGFIATLDKGDITAPGIVNTVAGPVAPYRIQASDCIMVSSLGNVSGWFPLYNRLKLLSVFGDVSALVGLKSLDMLKDSSAQMDISSRRGNINVTAVPPQQDQSGRKDGKLPLRDYASVLHTRIGNITAKLPIGSRTELETVSGHIDADLQPVLGYKSRDWNRNPWLNTLSESGNTRIRIREPIWTDAIEFPENDYPIQAASEENALVQRIGGRSNEYSLPFFPALEKATNLLSILSWKQTTASTRIAKQKEPWSNFESRHISSDGGLLLTYPDSWEGIINWQGTDTKGVSLFVDGVTILRQWGTVIKHVEARRGKGRSVVNVDTQGGIAVLAIGREITSNETDLSPSYPLGNTAGEV